MAGLKKVLIVDDSAPVRQQVGLALKQAGFEVVEAVDGLDGVEKFSKVGGFSMVICDVNMPRMTGIEFLEKVGSSVPVVMLTTEGQADLKKRAKALGARGWIIKPFVPDLLVAAVKQLVGA
jgi:two-component system chemotaxis response regulator CheY